MLKKYKQNAEVVVEILRVLRNMVADEERCSALGLLGTCEEVCATIKAHSKNKEVVQAGLEAVAKMSAADYDNSYSFVEAG